MNASKRVALSVNINKIALLRNSREGNHPDLLAYAKRCIELGADGITVHPRPDQRHIRAADIQPLAELVAQYPALEYNIEGNPFAAAQGSYPGFMALIAASRPHQCTLVPDTDSQLTSDHGFDLVQSGTALQPIIRELKELGVRVSLFMDPDIEQISLAAELGADRIELYTGPYAWAEGAAREELLAQHSAAARHAASLGLGVNAGHDLNLDNLPAYAAALPELQEVSIGHALTVDALEMGLATTLRAYQHALARQYP